MAPLSSMHWKGLNILLPLPLFASYLSGTYLNICIQIAKILAQGYKNNIAYISYQDKLWENLPCLWRTIIQFLLSTKIMDQH